jgi:hypothetical protein
MTCAINAHKKATMRQATANRESSGERRSKQSVSVYFNLPEASALNSNRLTPLTTVKQSRLSSRSGNGGVELIQNRGMVLQSTARVGLVWPAGFLASRFNGFTFLGASDFLMGERA